MVEEDEPVPGLKQFEKSIDVFRGRLAEGGRLARSKLDPGHIVEHVGVVGPRHGRVEECLRCRLFHRRAGHIGQRLEEGKEGIPLEGMALGHQQGLKRGVVTNDRHRRRG